MAIRILNTITAEMNDYSAANRQIASVILQRPEDVTRMSIASMARIAGVSEPTVMRFCRALGFSGYTDFKFSLIEELAQQSGGHFYSGLDNLEGGSYIQQVSRSAISALTTVAEEMDETAVNRAVALLTEAKHISFWGFGISSIVAQDAFQKFFRLGVSCTETSDAHIMSMYAGVMQEGDVAVAVSHTGRSSDLLMNVRIARKNGASVLGITSADSPLAEICTHTVCVNLNEDTDRVMPMISRMSHLLVIDLLTVGVMLHGGDATLQRIRRTKQSLESMKNPGKEDLSPIQTDSGDLLHDWGIPSL